MSFTEWDLSEYEDPSLYDRENQGCPELPLLLSWLQKQESGAILDLACGTGRLTLPVAEAGYSVIGVDLHEGMLEQARAKASPAFDIQWIHQDLTTLNLQCKAPLAYMVGNSFQHFLTNELQNRLLQSVHNQLADTGIFIFDMRFPTTDELLQPQEEEYWRTIQLDSQLHCDVYTIAAYDPLAQIQHYTTIRRFREQDRLVRERTTTIDLRYTYPQELSRLLELNGFDLLHVHGSWSAEPLQASSSSMVVICRKA
ncbi:class I SAM-dependent DNA methyltransferase [Paenibacillus alvei]|uniref:Class I SAM-dependent methyltransferase n=1 Tax=Paenibacillus alvei TaxID=44250 RepID=A0AAP6ZX43_PAEAL|nr:class I SAM-dependent methyltransferase [Paenibacillus alvei]NEZ40223.1 methyltransferase domain-containing protein [Paenibacillus alvei]NOJ71584.1 class I SAM-dependent methyltransferase [Paenibacillus alvei]